MPLAKEGIDNTYLNESRREPSFGDIPQPSQDLNEPNSSQSNESFHDKDEETLQRALNRIYENKILQLKSQFKGCEVDTMIERYEPEEKQRQGSQEIGNKH